MWALCTSRGSVEYKDLGVSNSFLWFFICAFLFFWLGDQLLGAILNFEILNIRVTNTVSFKDNPIWFILVCSLKLIFWLFSAVVVYKYIQSKFSAKST